MNEDETKILDELAELGQLFEDIVDESDKEIDSWWDSLSEDQQQLAFYSVVKRIVKGELRDKGSYRHVLYNVFGFDENSYFVGIHCGYMELHNSIYTSEEIRELRNLELSVNKLKWKSDEQR
jgi:hypothetical protein